MPKIAGATSRRWVWVAVGCAVVALLIALFVASALPILRHNAAEANCVAAVPAADGSPGGGGSATVSWMLLPTPHWACEYITDAGVEGSVNLGWWGSPR